MAERKRAGNTAVALGALAFLVSCYAILYGLQTLIFLEARMWQRAHPELSQVPQPLTINSAPEKPDAVLSAYGYKFDSPGGEVENVSAGLIFTSFAFRSGQRMIFFDPTTQLDTARQMKTAQPEKFQRFAAVFGDVLFPTNYALYESVFGASPAQLSLFLPEREMQRISALLLWKQSFATNAQTGIYSFATKRLRGFEQGDPARARYVLVKAFDPHDDQFEFIFTAKPGAQASVTQADINRVLQTFRPEWQPGA